MGLKAHPNSWVEDYVLVALSCRGNPLNQQMHVRASVIIFDQQMEMHKASMQYVAE